MVRCRDASFRSLGRRMARCWGLGLVAAGVMAAAPWALPSAARAIPEAEAIKKLQVIPVFVLTDERGVPLPIPRDTNLILPLYLESARANQQLAALRKANPTAKAQVLAVPLNVMNAKVADLNKQLKDKGKTLVAPVVGSDADRQQAVSLLKAQGVSEKQIDEGLRVPVFFTTPLLSIQSPQGPRQVFFLSYADLQTSIAKLPAAERGKLKPQVADLTAVLREIIKAPNDSFVIFPTQEYFRLVKESGGAKAP